MAKEEGYLIQQLYRSPLSRVEQAERRVTKRLKTFTKAKRAYARKIASEGGK